jgi:hypothetical protein
VSERHCEIDEVDGRLRVRDLESRAGTFVNGVQVSVAPLLPGDRLTVAQSDFVVVYDPPKGETTVKVSEADPGSAASGDHGAPRQFVNLVDLAALLDKQRCAYRKRYGRSLSEAEPVFPDPPHPEHLELLLVEELRRAGVDPALIFAFEKTGVLVTQFNQRLIREDDIAAWRAAIDEYRRGDRGCGEDQQFPAGIVTTYGPDRTTATMIVAVVMASEDAEPVHRCWVGGNVKAAPDIRSEIADFFFSHAVRSVLYVKENVGCPHEEGVDYPEGEDCPFCPYWEGKQGRD